MMAGDAASAPCDVSYLVWWPESLGILKGRSVHGRDCKQDCEGKMMSFAMAWGDAVQIALPFRCSYGIGDFGIASLSEMEYFESIFADGGGFCCSTRFLPSV